MKTALAAGALAAVLLAAHAAGVLASGGQARAAGFEVPDGFVTVPDDGQSSSSEDWEPVLSVRPKDGPFAELTSLSLRRVKGSVDDPDAWLKERLTVDVPTDAEVTEVLDSPDSPFADPAFEVLRQAMPQLFAGLRGLGRIGAELCDKPQAAYNAAGPLREMYCTFQIGPLRQYMLLRLQKTGGDWYYTEIKTANDRRLRELVGVANTFAR
jgi:hypothetical protein